jgi:acyl-CoA synthetase (NDP forming)
VLAPESVAIVGASEDNYYARSVVENLDRYGYLGSISPVHPTRQTAFGRNCFRSLADAPTPDVVIISLNRGLVEQVVEEAIGVGAAGVVVLATGFRDSGQPEWVEAERRIATRAADTGLLVVGPYTLGLISVKANAYLYATPVKRRGARGNVALIMQSGALVASTMRYLDTVGIGVEHAVGIGNGTATTAGAWLDALGADESVSVIGLLLESIVSWTEFRAAAERACGAGKAIVICKTGRSEIGQAIAYSHTGALATTYAVERGGFDQLGIRVADSVNELVMTIALLSRFGEPGKRTLGILGQSGGSNGQLADQCAELGISLPQPAAATIAQIQQGGRYTAKGNPIDLADHAMADRDAFSAAVQSFIADPAFGAILYGATLDEDSALHREFLRRVQEAAGKVGKPLIAVPACYTQIGSNTLKLFESADGGSMVAPVIDHVLRGIGAWFMVDPQVAHATVASEAAGGRTQWRNEHEIKELLREAGVSVPQSTWIPKGTLFDASRSTAFAGTVAVKGVGVDVHHKSRLGLVRLAVPFGILEVNAALAEVSEAARAAKVQLDGVLVEESIDGPVDLIISLASQPAGVALLIGKGGVDVERGLFRVFSILPVSDEYLSLVLGRTGVASDTGRAACIDLIRSLTAMFEADGLKEIECNPVRIDEQGQAWVLDTLALA